MMLLDESTTVDVNSRPSVIWLTGKLACVKSHVRIEAVCVCMCAFPATVNPLGLVSSLI